MPTTIAKEISIEELLEVLPEAAGILIDYGIVCVQCGEPVWGTIEEAARKKGLDAAAIDAVVVLLNERLADKERGDRSGRY